MSSEKAGASHACQSESVASGSGGCQSRCRSSADPSDATSAGKTILPPCKLVEQLAANPSADITQLPIVPDEGDTVDNPDSTSCARAYQLLMQYATTDEKLKALASTVAQGCVPDKTAGRGCSMKNMVIMDALDGALQG